MSSRPRILLIRRRYLGDLVLLGSVLRNLRLHWHQAHLTVLTEAAYAGVLSLQPDINGALTFPTSATGWLSFVRALRRARFTHVLDFDNTDKTALVTRLTGAPIRATYNRELIPFRHAGWYTHTAKVTNAFYDSHHITETYLALPAALGVPIVSREVMLRPHHEDLAELTPLLGGDLKHPDTPRYHKRVLVHPGSRSEHRIWPLERFANVCDRLQDELNLQVFVTAGFREKKLVESIKSQAHSYLMIPEPPKTIGALAALMSQFDAVLCHDSGPMHVAAAVGTPVVALFSSQNATIWRPLGPGHTVLQTELPCACLGAEAPSPCVKGDSYQSWCVRKLTADQVFDAVQTTVQSDGHGD
jgi:ADP-heptose:LPS heptosyltransferase